MKSLVASILVLLVTGCSSTDVVSERTGTAHDPLIGGVAAGTPALDAVGSLVSITRYPGSPR